jgi:hypothetical protein
MSGGSSSNWDCQWRACKRISLWPARGGVEPPADLTRLPVEIGPEPPKDWDVESPELEPGFRAVPVLDFIANSRFLLIIYNEGVDLTPATPVAVYKLYPPPGAQGEVRPVLHTASEVGLRLPLVPDPLRSRPLEPPVGPNKGWRCIEEPSRSDLICGEESLRPACHSAIIRRDLGRKGGRGP